MEYSCCIDCKKLIYKSSQRCKSCENKYRFKTGVYLKRNFNGINNPNFKDARPKCLDCGIIISYGTRRCNKCSKQGKNNHMYDKRGIKSPLFGRLRLNHSYRMKGINNPNWKGGISKEPYSFDFDKTLKHHIRRRDGFACQLCGIMEPIYLLYQRKRRKRLTIHHIDYDKKNCNEKNLRTLCQSCNSKVNFNRSFWTKYFQSKEAFNHANQSNNSR